MTACVVDASVVAAAFFPEPHADAARALLASGRELRAPDLVWPEVANVVWKRQRRGEIDADEAGGLLRDVLRLPLHVEPSAGLVGAALQLAVATGRTVYDCLYLALAVRSKGTMVTADRRLAAGLAGSPLEKHISWIGA